MGTTVLGTIFVEIIKGVSSKRNIIGISYKINEIVNSKINRKK